MMNEFFRYQLSAGLFLFLLISVPAFAQGEVLIHADRPGTGDGAYVLNRQVFNLETGISGDNDLYQIGQLVVRYGLLDRFEIQARLNSIIISPEATRADYESQAIGFKLGILQQKKGGPIDLSFKTTMELPFLNADYEHWLTRFTILSAYQLTETWSLEANVGYGDFVSDVADGSWFFSVTPSSYFVDNPGFGYYFGYAKSYGDFVNDNVFETGITWLINPTAQVDFGIHFIDDVSGFGMGIGFSKAFNTD